MGISVNVAGAIVEIISGTDIEQTHSKGADHLSGAIVHAKFLFTPANLDTATSERDAMR